MGSTMVTGAAMGVEAGEAVPRVTGLAAGGAASVSTLSITLSVAISPGADIAAGVAAQGVTEPRVTLTGVAVRIAARVAAL